MKILHESVGYSLKGRDEAVKLINKKFSKAFIATTVQYKGLLTRLVSKDKGIVLGCNVSVMKGFKGSTIVFVGDGLFHALMIKRVYKNKKVFVVNFFNLNVKEVTGEDVKRFDTREALGLEALNRAKKVGVIVSIKLGQAHLKEALWLKKKLENQGKTVYLFMFDTVNPDEFLNFPGLDCLINTACPRLALDDYTKFPVPVVNHTSI